MKRAALAVLTVTVLAVLTIRAAAPIPVMILDGESGGAYHDWQRVTPVLRKMLDETGLFVTTVVTAPPANGDFSGFQPDFEKYQVVVMNYDAPDQRWPSCCPEGGAARRGMGRGTDRGRAEGGHPAAAVRERERDGARGLRLRRRWR